MILIIKFEIIDQYINLLTQNGVLVLAHGTHGGGMDLPSMNLESLHKWAKNQGLMTAGPYHFFLYKHLRMRTCKRFPIIMQSYISKYLQLLCGQRWIKFFLLAKT